MGKNGEYNYRGIERTKKKVKILLTGATGFIGKNLLRFLISKGFQVFCVVRDVDKLLKLEEPAELIQIIEGDLNDSSTYAKLPKSISVVIHLAALLGDWKINEDKIIKTNIEMSERLLNWFFSSGCKQFIFISTPGVQGFGYKLAKETDPYNPRDIYEKTKVVTEEMIQDFNFKPDQNWTIIRPDFVYGPEDKRRIKLYKKVKAHRWIKIGKGDSVLRPTFVTDVCRAIIVCLENPMAYSQIFNVAGPQLITSEQYIDTISKVLRANLLPLRFPSFLIMVGASFFERVASLTYTKPLFTKSQVNFLTQDHGTDVSKIKDLIGFIPTIDLEKGMQETLTWAEKEKLL